MAKIRILSTLRKAIYREMPLRPKVSKKHEELNGSYLTFVEHCVLEPLWRKKLSGLVKIIKLIIRNSSFDEVYFSM